MSEPIEAAVQQAAENVTETLTGSKIPATPEGAAVAYSSLIIMAMLPIFFGALRSVKHQTDQKVSESNNQTQRHVNRSEFCLHVTWLITLSTSFISLHCHQCYCDFVFYLWYFQLHRLLGKSWNEWTLEMPWCSQLSHQVRSTYLNNMSNLLFLIEVNFYCSCFVRIVRGFQAVLKGSH